MLVARLTMIAYNLHPSYHCAYCEETQQFRSDHRERDQLLPVGVSDAAEHGLGCDGIGGGAGAG